MGSEIASIEKGKIKLTEYVDSTYGYEDRIFLQNGCVGFYMTPGELKDLHTVVSYYLNAEEFTEIQVKVGGDHVAL